MHSNKLKFAALVLFGILFLTRGASAVVISPLKYTSTIDPGKDQNFVITIKNDQSAKKYYRVSAVGVQSTIDGKLLYQRGSDRAEAWATPNPFAFSLEAGASRIVNVSIKVPAGEEPGSHSIAFLISEQNKNDGTVSLSTNVAVPVMLIVSGKVTESVEISKWVSLEKFYSAKSWKFYLEMKNTGSVSVDGIGEVSVVGPMHKNFLRQKLYVGNTLLRGSLRHLETTVSPSGFLLPGKYFVDLALVYGNGNRISKVTTVWYVPVWSMAAGAILIVVVIIFYLWRTKRKKT